MNIDEKDIARFWYEQDGERMLQDVGGAVGGVGEELLVEVFAKGFRVAKIIFDKSETEQE